MIITKLFSMFLIIVIIILIVNLLKVESFYVGDDVQIQEYIKSINNYIVEIDNLIKGDDYNTNLGLDNLLAYVKFYRDTLTDLQAKCKAAGPPCEADLQDAKKLYIIISNIYNSYLQNTLVFDENKLDEIKDKIQKSLTTQTIFSKENSATLQTELTQLQTKYENIKTSMAGHLNDVSSIKITLNNWTEYLEEAVKTKSFNNIVGLRSRHKPSIRIYFHTTFGNSEINININIKTKKSDDGSDGYLIISDNKLQNGDLSSNDDPFVFIVKKISNETEYKNENENKKVNPTSYPFYLITTTADKKIIAINKDFNTNYLELNVVNGKIYEQFDPIYD